MRNSCLGICLSVRISQVSYSSRYNRKVQEFKELDLGCYATTPSGTRNQRIVSRICTRSIKVFRGKWREYVSLYMVPKLPENRYRYVDSKNTLDAIACAFPI